MNSGRSPLDRNWWASRFLVAVLAGVTACLGPVLAAVAAEPESETDAAVAPAEKVERQAEIGFQQDRAEAHMRELEERMFRLANLIRESQPDDAARLLMGVRKARENLIADRMNQVSNLLASLKLEQASGEQQEIIQKLEDLKKLLLTADIGLELKLEQLRKLRQAAAQLERLIRREKSQNEQTQQLTKRTAPDEDFAALEDNEQRNRRSAENLEQMLREFGSSSARATESLSNASSSMSQAAQQLAKKSPQPAGAKQKKAIQELEQAQSEVKKLEEQLRKEIEALARQQIMENILEMITRQVEVRETTVKLAPRVADEQRQALLSIRRLATAEDEIAVLAVDSIDLAELAELSVVLPTALRFIKDEMVVVAEHLRSGRADDDVVAEERKIETDLEALLDMLKLASRPSNSPGGQCSNCGGNRFKLLSEIKMLRWMESSLHVETQRIDALLEETQAGDDVRRRQAEALSAWQELIREMTGRLHQQTCPHCLGVE